MALASPPRPVGRKGYSGKADETSATTVTLTMGYIKYQLNKIEALTFQEHQYFILATMIQYFVTQHAVSTNTLVLIDHRAKSVPLW
jgi:hypothetical protein